MSKLPDLKAALADRANQVKTGSIILTKSDQVIYVEETRFFQVPI